MKKLYLFLIILLFLFSHSLFAKQISCIINIETGEIIGFELNRPIIVYYADFKNKITKNINPLCSTDFITDIEINNCFKRDLDIFKKYYLINKENLNVYKYERVLGIEEFENLYVEGRNCTVHEYNRVKFEEYFFLLFKTIIKDQKKDNKI